ncbi:MAG TPA: methylmalonyl-CoA mutase family protein [Fibrobacteria bacterium]|nr:methylmalonyl-CoA mutase family protein [Fibrobacteria bacterium]
MEKPVIRLKHPVRFLTAASLFDGHDAAIHIMRRVLVAEGAEVIHLGHDRSVSDVVEAAVQEDVQGIAVSSYQGGHLEYFTYMVECLRKRGCGHIRVYGGGGGVITPEEIAILHKRGVARIFSPEDGRTLGLEGMIRLMLKECDHLPGKPLTALPRAFSGRDAVALGRALSTLEWAREKPARGNPSGLLRDVRARLGKAKACPVVGITGTGGAGKSSLVDEVLVRFLQAFPGKRAAVLCVDPSRRRTGGALLGDRLRVNCAGRSDRVYFRSMATRRAHAAMSATVKDGLRLLQAAGFDLILLETAGIGQSDTEVTEVADMSVYVMTPEYGAPSQLEKIGMLDYSDFVVLNKFDRHGAEDALRDVRKAYQRNRKLFGTPLEKLPVFGTCAHRFQDPGTHGFCNALFARLGWTFEPFPEGSPDRKGLLPRDRADYLRRIAATVAAYHRGTADQAAKAAAAEHVYHALRELGESVPGKAEAFPGASKAKASGPKGTRAGAGFKPAADALRARYQSLLSDLDPGTLSGLRGFESLRREYEAGTQSYRVRGKDIEVRNHTASLSGLEIPKVSLPAHAGWGDQVEFLRSENVPGRFPFTAGVFPFKREGEDPTRMFAGEGTAERTNARFHYVSKGQKAVRLSTAFDSVTLYGADPDPRPDIYGKVGNSGVSVCCLDDAKRLYSGFDLCAPDTSVSMTINGPAPILLAFFFNTAVDAACERWLRKTGRWEKTARKIARWFKDKGIAPPRYRSGKLPEGHDGSGLGFLGLPADAVMDGGDYARIRAEVLRAVRGTVQADILKEDQAQNTCIFSTEFSLRLMGDTQRYFLDHGVRNFYSVSISGYHIAEAGANPITQLALTLANGFTYVEYYQARGMAVDGFAPNLSFFFSNGLDPEYAVLGRVARRIWAIAMRDFYGADERSQKLKYHIQTSGRSLHAQEIDFNDIRTTLQALLAVGDNCNSLHTNAFDEAVTTPTEASVRRAIAIQLIINRELGLVKNENPMQGSHFLTRLTSLVEEAVLRVFGELDARGGVLGAMEMNFQRSRIQEESMLYERRKQSGELPLVGVNTFLNPGGPARTAAAELIRSTEREKRDQVDQVKACAERFPAESAAALERLKSAARKGGNLFGELLEASKYCTLGAISGALFEVGGAYRRNT